MSSVRNNKSRTSRFGKLLDSAREASTKSLPNAQTALSRALREPNQRIKEEKQQHNDDSDIEEAISTLVSEFVTSVAVNSTNIADDKAPSASKESLLSDETKQRSSSIPSAISPLQPRAVPITELHPFVFPDTLSRQEILAQLPHSELLFFDTETTGIAKSDRIIELAFVYRNYITMQERQFYALVNPQGKKSSAAAYEAHKISPELLRFAKPMPEVLEEILSFLRSIHSDSHSRQETRTADTHNSHSIPIVAHNAHFDFRMLHQELCRITNNSSLSSDSFACFPRDRFLCSYQLARQFNGMAKGRNSLSSLCEQFGIDLSSRAYCHGAMQDTLLLADLYPYIVREASLFS